MSRITWGDIAFGLMCGVLALGLILLARCGVVSVHSHYEDGSECVHEHPTPFWGSQMFAGHEAGVHTDKPCWPLEERE